MSASTINEGMSEVEAPKSVNNENVEDSIVENLDGALESSGASLELQALHLQASTVTFTGVPSPQPSDTIPHQEVPSDLPTNASVSKLPHDSSMHIDCYTQRG